MGKDMLEIIRLLTWKQAVLAEYMAKLNGTLSTLRNMCDLGGAASSDTENAAFQQKVLTE